MAIETSTDFAPKDRSWMRGARGVIVLAMGGIAIASPFFAGSLALLLIGGLLVASGVLELRDAMRSANDENLRVAYLSGEVSILTGILLLAIPELVLRGVAIVLAVSFLIDGLGKLVRTWRAYRAGTGWLRVFVNGLVNIGLAGMLAARWPISDWTIVAVVVGLRMMASGWSMMLGRDAPEQVADLPRDAHPDATLGLPPHAVFVEMNESMEAKEQSRRPIDAFWCWIFILVFLAIHVGRMQVYWNAVGMIAPLAALVGDLAVALVVAFVVILPARLAWRTVTRPLERRSWQAALKRAEAETPSSRVETVIQAWLNERFRFARRLGQMRYSLRSGMAWGLKVGLPITAVWIAIQPIFGFSWFFNSENWASIVWQKWAETRTDVWREGMVTALEKHYTDLPESEIFQVEPGIKGDEDFSFLVIGDNGEGTAAQHSLRDQYLTLGKRPDLKFLVVSSDVIYPDGAMRDYEHNFYLPFKGFTKPIYAIPGNHDWYDALEGFAANLLKPEAARVCMRSRVIEDGRLTTTTEGRIEGYIDEAARLRKEYDVKTGLQRGPFFEVQTNRFALIAVDTGVLKTVDSNQYRWLKGALERSKGKFTMVLLGHPLFTAGYYQGDPEYLRGESASRLRPSGATTEDVVAFTTIHRMLREHKVDLVMAGDMHLFEHYQEIYSSEGKERTMHHFVNGGGGAYICVGVPFDWPADPATKLWTYYPSKNAVIEKLDAQTPLWKMPLWLWVKHFAAWPFNGYIMSAAFDHDHAPYFQSFVDVQVKNSSNEVRLVPYCARGPMRWRDLENYRALVPIGKTENDLVEFVIKMPPR